MFKKILVIGAIVSSLLASKCDIYLQNAFQYMKKSKHVTIEKAKYYEMRASNYLKIYKMCMTYIGFPIKDLK